MEKERGEIERARRRERGERERERGKGKRECEGRVRERERKQYGEVRECGRRWRRERRWFAGACAARND